MRIPKFAALVIYLFLTTLFIASCKKEELPQYPISGLWEGLQYSDVVNAPPQYYALSIKPDSTITVEGIADGVNHYATGTWSLKKGKFKSEIITIYGIYSNIGTKQTLTADFNENKGTLSSGRWFNSEFKNDSGRFEVKFVK